MRFLSTALIGLFLFSTVADICQYTDPTLNRAIESYLTAYRKGDAEGLVGAYEKQGFNERARDTVDRLGLLKALRDEFQYRGAPTMAKARKILVNGDRACVAAEITWKSGYSEENWTFWIRLDGQWFATVNQLHATNPDRKIWAAYENILKSALSKEPPSPEELDNLKDLSKAIMEALAKNECGLFERYYVPYRHMGALLGWDLQGDIKEECAEFHSETIKTYIIKSDWLKAAATWEIGALLVDPIQGNEVTNGAKLCCVDVWVPTPNNGEYAPGYSLKWIRASQGWRIWEVTFNPVVT